MRAFSPKVRGGFFDWEIVDARDVSPERAKQAIPPLEAARAVEAALEDPVAREHLKQILDQIQYEYESLSDPRYAAQRLMWMLQVQQTLMFTIIEALMPRPPHPVPPGPLPIPPQKTLSEVSILLLDQGGKPLGGPACSLSTTDGATHESPKLPPSGRFRVDRIPVGTCSVRFPNIRKRSGDLVPPRFAVKNVDGAIPVTRGDEASEWDVGTRVPEHVFQLQARRASVVELEQFLEGGAILMAGREGFARRPGAPIVSGIDALRACLERALPLDRMRLTGHDSTLARERAECVLHLLTADRDAFVKLARAHGREFDWRIILVWVAATKGWDCVPGENPKAAVMRFQAAYNHDFSAAIDVDGVVGRQSWGAIFDLYMQALRPPAPKTLASHPYIIARYGKDFVPHVVARDGTGDAERYIEMNPYNPTKPKDPTLKYDRGWYDTWPGETVYLPDDWDQYVEKLREKGWDAHHGTRATEGPPPMPKPGPRAIGCGAHHALTPNADDRDRRGEHRAVELVLLDPGEDPDILCGPGAETCPSPRCELYDPREYVIRYLPVTVR